MKKHKEDTVVAPVTRGGCIIAASGPSFSGEQAALIRREAGAEYVVIAVSDAFRQLPDADIVYACDYDWWRENIEAVRARVQADARLVTIDPAAAEEFTLELVACLDLHYPKLELGLSGIPGVITNGCSSGYQALHIAVNEGEKRILLVGFDYGGSGQHRWNGMPSLSNFPVMLEALNTLAVGIGHAGVEVVNCTLETAVSCFKRATLESVL